MNSTKPVVSFAPMKVNGTSIMICVVDYNPDWPVAYARETGSVSSASGNAFVRIHHIGSTAIPGIKAKPVIDMLLEVTAVEALDDRSAYFNMLSY